MNRKTLHPFLGIIVCLTINAQAQVFRTYYPYTLQGTTTQPLKEEFEYKDVEGNIIKDGIYTKYYEASGKRMTDGQYSNGKREGAFKDFYESSIPKWDRTYHNNWLQGQETHYNVYGKSSFFSEYKQLETIDTITKSDYKTFNADRRLVSEGQLANDRLHGIIKEYYADGTLKSKTQYNHGKPNGPLLVYNSKGNLIQRGFYQEGKLSDSLYSFYPNGNVKSVGLFANGMPNGTMNVFWENGKIKESSNYVNDTLEGAYSLFYENGEKDLETKYSSGLLDGSFVRYYDDGKPREKSIFLKGLKEGKYEEFYPSGVVKIKGEYRKDVMHGNNKLYYESGKIKNDFNYFEGQKVGDNYSYYENGQLDEVLVFIDNKHIKEKQKYHPNGSFEYKSKNKYKPSKTEPGKEDHWEYKTIYFEDKSLKAKQCFLNEAKHGKWSSYDEKGNKIVIENYLRDKLHGTQTTYGENNSVSSSIEFLNGFKHGQSTTFDKQEDGSIIKTSATYRRDVLHGPYQVFSGKVLSTKGQYISGKKDKIWYFYDDQGRLVKQETYKRDKLINSKEFEHEGS